MLAPFLNTGVDTDTPSDLVDRIVYSNWVCVIGTLINVLGAQANVLGGYHFLFIWNIVYQIAIVAMWFLNLRKRYLAGRILFLASVCVGITLTSAVQGPAVQMEHFLLAIAALAFTLFHPSERRWAWFFGGYSAVAYLILVHQPGPLLPLQVNVGMLSAEDERVNQFCYVLLDVFALIALSNAYARAIGLVDRQRTKLFESSKLASLGQMAGGIAHEINNPLAIIDALSEKLILKSEAQNLSQEELQSTLKDLQNTAHRIVSIVQGLRNFSRDGAQLPFELTSLNAVMDNTVSLCQERFGAMKIELHDVRAARDVMIRCRPVQVSQVLLNLLNNACDAASSCAKPWVQLRVSLLESNVRIVVRNSGAKILPEIQEKLFQPFFTTKEVGQGTGLGLSISLAIAKEHGGALTLDPQDTHTSFILSLPFA